MIAQLDSSDSSDSSDRIEDVRIGDILPTLTATLYSAGLPV